MKRLSHKTKNSGKNSYKFLYWMGAGVLVLLVGVVVLALMNRPKPYVVADPERTLIWMYDSSNPAGPTAGALIEESRSAGTLTAVPFSAPEEARQVFAKDKAYKTQVYISDKVGRTIHHRIFLPFTVIGKLIDAAGGVKVNGQTMNSAAALAYIRDGGDQSASRASQVMLALPDAVNQNGISMGISEGLSLARQVDTDIELMDLQKVFERWSSYGSPKVVTLSSQTYEAIQQNLKPDPPKTESK